MFMHYMPGATWGEVLYNFIVIYLAFTFGLTVFSVARMYLLKHRCNGVKYGKLRMKKLERQGKLRQIPLYTMEEIAKNKDLGTVRLSVFPNTTGEKKKYVLILPGGGYAHCVTKEEGYPIAAKLNELGYPAFVLEYRTGLHCSAYAPMEDVSRAIKHIEANAKEYNVEVEGYALCGFSAGGNLAGMYGSNAHGYAQYYTRKPGTLILGYPWTNVRHWADHPYWNIWIGLMGIWLSERGFLYMFGLHRTSEQRESLCVQNHVTSEYPPTYMFSGSRDVLVPASHHAEVLEESFREYKIKYIYRRFFGLPHGIGLGLNTAARGWLEEAVAFWEEQTAP